MIVEYVKRAGEYVVAGGKDEDGEWAAECTCGHSILAGLETFNDVQKWVKSHAARHMLKAVAR